jgi:ubiquinone/menaquinone biosynthesis C-methylase UbiE
MSPELHTLISVSVVVGVMFLLHGQCRKPRWWIGKRLAQSMNLQHSGVTDWGLAHVSIDEHFTILDVGCGGGRTIEKLAHATPNGRVFGVDYSAACVDVARRANAASIAVGKVDIEQGSVSKIPRPDDTFDLVTAVETHYYWPNLTEDLREIRRVLKPGGRLLIIAETYKGRRFDFVYRPVMTLMLRATYLTQSEHHDALVTAGFADVEVFEQRAKGWICVVGTKPGSNARRARA